MNIKKIYYVVLALIIVSFIFTGCLPEDYAPAPESDSSQNYKASSQIPVDDNVYTITGEVISDVDSITRQTRAARGNTSGSVIGSVGYIGGSYYGPEFGGKGLIRLYVMESNSNLAPFGEIIIIKSTDLKGAALLPGDIVTFKCRAQYEALAAVRNNSSFDSEVLETWELDYCRMINPSIFPSESNIEE